MNVPHFGNAVRKKNMFLNDAMLFKAASALPSSLLSGFEELGSFVSSEEAWEYTRLANEYRPVLRRHNDWGQLIEVVELNTSYQALARYSRQNGLSASLWERRESENGIRYQSRAIRLFLLAGLESGHLSEISTTSAGIAALTGENELFRQWQQVLLSRRFDNSSRPLSEKNAASLSFAFTDRFEGTMQQTQVFAQHVGFDEKLERDIYRIHGGKRRVVYPNADGVFVIADLSGEPSCFFVPRFDEQSSKRQFVITELLQEAGLKSRPVGEIEFQANRAWLVGQIGKGAKILNDIETMLRFDQAVISAGILRRVIDYGVTLLRFQNGNVEDGMNERVFADMALDVAAAEALVLRLARAFDHATQDRNEAAFARIMTPVAAFWINNLIAPIVSETIMQAGSPAFYADSPLPRLLSDGAARALEAIGANRLVQDVVRSAQRAPGLFKEILKSLGNNLGNAGPRTVEVLGAATQVALNDPTAGRLLIEQMAYAAGASSLVEGEVAHLINAFVESRLAGQWRSSYGTLSARHNARLILDTLYPAV